jgi:hypothetical protein
MIMQEISIVVGERKARVSIAVSMAILFSLAAIFSQTGESQCDTEYKVLFSDTHEHSGCITITDAHAFQSFTRK